jgi:hypothetical protein
LSAAAVFWTLAPSLGVAEVKPRLTRECCPESESVNLRVATIRPTEFAGAEFGLRFPDRLLYGARKAVWKLCQDRRGGLWGIRFRDSGVSDFKRVMIPFRSLPLVEHDKLSGWYICASGVDAFEPGSFLGVCREGFVRLEPQVALGGKA